MARSDGIRAGLKYLTLGLGGAAVGAALGGAPKLAASNSAGGGETTPVRSAEPARTARYEIIAFEAPGCTYCAHFRNDISRSYNRSERAKIAPVRFLDLNDAKEIARLNLSQAITSLPTAVIMRDGVEVGRIGGYIGRENFYKVLDGLIVLR